jgi:hypothetical protein
MLVNGWRAPRTQITLEKTGFVTPLKPLTPFERFHRNSFRYCHLMASRRRAPR